MLLERYVEQAYPSASPAERALFEDILELADPLLTDYLLGHVRPAEPGIAELVERIATHRA